MELSDVYRELAEALRRAETRATEAERELADLRARFDQLIVILSGKGHLVDGHRELMIRVGAEAAHKVEPRVKLRVVDDKYEVPNADIDCAAKIPYCRARCCGMSFELSPQDLDEGIVRWELTRPYVIRHEPDGYCTHLDRSSGFCGVHANRPAVCRFFDCREDARIWIDFENNIATPLPGGISAIDPPAKVTAR